VEGDEGGGEPGRRGRGKCAGSSGIPKEAVNRTNKQGG